MSPLTLSLFKVTDSICSSIYLSKQEYLLHLTAPLYASLGFTAAANEEHVTAYHRNIILNINCEHGNQDCVDTASQLLESFRNNPSELRSMECPSGLFPVKKALEGSFLPGVPVAVSIALALQ